MFHSLEPGVVVHHELDVPSSSFGEQRDPVLALAKRDPKQGGSRKQPKQKGRLDIQEERAFSIQGSREGGLGGDEWAGRGGGGHREQKTARCASTSLPVVQ